MTAVDWLTDPALPTWQQDEKEFAALLALLEPLEPQRILEIGVFAGGTLARFVRAFPDATVVGVDIGSDAGSVFAPVVVGDSQDPYIQSWALNILDGTPDFVFIDGDHSDKVCRSDLEWAIRMDARAIGLHDIACRVHPALDCYLVWDELCAEFPDDTTTIAHSDWNGIGYWRRRA